MLPNEIRTLTYSGFKTKARSYVMDHSREFLNVGNKDKEVAHKIFEPSEDKIKTSKSKESNTTGKGIKNVQIKELRERYKKTFRNQDPIIGVFGSKKPKQTESIP